MHSAKNPRLLPRLVITLACGLTVLVLFELFLRQVYSYVTLQRREGHGGILEADPGFLYRHTAQGKRLLPNTHVVIHNHYVSHRDVAIDTNSLGFRAEEFPLQKQPGELRILALGDSITIADSLDVREIFTTRLEQQLKSTFPNKMVRVINAGVGNIGTREELDILEEQGLKVKPDWVLLNFYLNDSRPSWGFSAEVSHRGWLRRHSLIVEAIYQKILLGKWLKATGPQALQWVSAQNKLDWAHNRGEFMKLVDLARFDWGAGWQEDSWKLVDWELTRLSQLSQTYHFRVALAVFPVSFQVYADFMDDAPQKKLRQLAGSLGFEVLDLLPALRGSKSLDLFLDQCHLTPAGHKLVADKMTSWFTELLPG